MKTRQKINSIDAINGVNNENESIALSIDSLAKNSFLAKRASSGNYWIINQAFEGYVTPEGEVYNESTGLLEDVQTWETMFEILHFDIFHQSAYIALGDFSACRQGVRTFVNEAIKYGSHLTRVEKKFLGYISRNIVSGFIPEFLKLKKFPLGHLLTEGYVDEFFHGEFTEFKRVYIPS